MTNPRESSLDVGSLLTIDVAAEVRKLGQAQLGGSWQVPGELAARAIRAGAKSIAVTFDRKGFSVRDDGKPISAETLRSLASVLDPRAAPEERHRALIALEAAGELALVALAGAGAESLSIASGATLRWKRGGDPVIDASAARLTSIDAAGASFDRTEARRWLTGAFRFLTSARLDVDGAPVAQGFAGALAAEPLRGRLPGVVALPREGDTARVWLLLDGVVATHVGVPSAPCFEASVEVRSLVGPRGGAPEAREAIAGFLPELEQHAVSLIARVAKKASSLSEADRTRLRSAVLAAARHGSREAIDAPVFLAIAAGGVTRWLSIADLKTLASGGRAIAAIYPHLDASLFVLPPASAPALLLDAAERARLAPLVGGAGFSTPPARPPSRSRFSRGFDALVSLLSSLPRVFARPVPDAALSAPERALLDALRARLPIQVAFCAGRATPRARGRLLLARENPLVRASVAAVARDPRNAALAATALAPDSSV